MPVTLSIHTTASAATPPGRIAERSFPETATTFAFSSDTGTFTARKERAGNKRGGWYWKAYSTQQGKLSSLYLGKSEALTLERLNTVAQALAHAPVEDAAGEGERSATEWLRTDR